MTAGAPPTTAARWVTALSLGAILLATLTPSTNVGPPAGPWCIVCGDVGTVDVLQNIILFIPLGIGLALMRVPARRAIVTAFVLTTSIELAQYFAIPGRDGSLGDVVMNTLGTGVGLGLVAWRVNPLAPTTRVASWMRSSSMAAWTAIALLGTAGMRSQTVSAPYTVADPPPPPPSAGEPTDARILRVWVDSQPVPPAPAGMPPVVAHTIDARHSSMAADVSTVGPRAVPERLLRLVSQIGPLFSFGQAGNTFSCSRRIVATGLRFRTPSISVGVPVADGATWTAGEDMPVHLVCTRDPGRLSLAVTFEGRRARQSTDLTPGASWMLLLPGFLVAGSESIRELTGACWLFVLALALGYCAQLPAVLSIGGGRPSPASTARAGLVPLALVAMMQLGAPRLAGTLPSPWWELVASVAGIALGTAIARRYVSPGGVGGAGGAGPPTVGPL